MAYVDGFLLVVPKKNLAAYKTLAKIAAKVWMEHGALQYRECVGDDLDLKCGVPFPTVAGAKRGELTMFSYIVYKSRAQRDRVNKLVMQDARIMKAMKGKKPPFDIARMSMGGFKVLVEA